MPGARVVVAPDGREWRVGREWFARRVPRNDPPDPSWPVDFAEHSAGSLVAGIVVVVVGVLALLVVWPLVAIAIEVALFVVLFLAGLAGRLVLRRPWRVVACTDGREVKREAVGWRASGETIEAMAAALAAGREPA